MNKKFCIITICLSLSSEEFNETFKSICNQHFINFIYIVVASKANKQEIKNLKKRIKQYNLESIVITNKDTSLYNAMNIGLDQGIKLPTLFLNSGDTLINNLTSNLISKNIDINKINAFSVIQKFRNHGFLRLPEDKIYKKSIVGFINYLFKNKRLPPHQGILFNYNLESKQYRFKERIGYHADSLMFEEIINNHPIKYHNEPICIFKLGGLSSKPSLIKIRNSLKRFNQTYILIEITKLIVYKLLGEKNYYILVNLGSKNKHIDITSIK